MLDRFVPQIALDGPRIDAIIRQLVAAAVPQHVRMDFHVEACRAGGTFHHVLKDAEKLGDYIADRLQGRLERGSSFMRG